MTGDIDALKAKARRLGFDRRAAAHAKGDGAAAGALSSVLAGYRGVPVSGYMPIRTEIDPLPAMAEACAHGRVGVPVIVAPGQALRFAAWSPDMAMKRGPFGALVPAEPVYFDPEILIVPLVAFDVCGGRLGYGGGYYDRTLAGLRQRRPTLAIGFAYAAQQAETLPCDAFDQPLDLIVTEHGVIDPQAR